MFLSSPVASTSALLNDHLKVIGPGTGLVPLQLRMDVDALMTIDPSMGPNDMDTLTLSTYMSIDNALSAQSGVFLTAVPEPSAVVLASMGLALLAWRGRRCA